MVDFNSTCGHVECAGLSACIAPKVFTTGITFPYAGPTQSSRQNADRNDLLWAMWALARVAWPLSVGQFFEMHGVPSLRDEYEAVRSRLDRGD